MPSQVPNTKSICSGSTFQIHLRRHLQREHHCHGFPERKSSTIASQEHVIVGIDIKSIKIVRPPNRVSLPPPPFSRSRPAPPTSVSSPVRPMGSGRASITKDSIVHRQCHTECPRRPVRVLHRHLPYRRKCHRRLYRSGLPQWSVFRACGIYADTSRKQDGITADILVHITRERDLIADSNIVSRDMYDRDPYQDYCGAMKDFKSVCLHAVLFGSVVLLATFRGDEGTLFMTGPCAGTRQYTTGRTIS